MVKDKDILRKAIAQGFGTLIIREFLIKLFSFVGQLFLARLLAPSDFGVYVIIVFIVNLFGLFSDIGLSLAIIQKKGEPTQLELSGVFWLKVFLSLALTFLIWIYAPLVKIFYTTFVDVNVDMLRVFSLTLFLASLRAIPISLLERKIKYNLISLLDIIGVFVYYVVALSGALLHFGVWSFIVSSLVKEMIETVILYIVNPFFPTLMFRLDNIRKMIKFGIFIQGNSLVVFFISSMIPVVGGRVSGPYGVGLLDFANNLTSLPGLIAMNFGRVAFATYSRMQKQKKLLFSSIDSSISLLSLLLYFFPIIIFGFGGELVKTIYTEKWASAIPALYWFGMAAFFHPINAAIGQGILSLGQSKEIVKATLIISVAGWILAYALVNLFGFVGIAISIFLISFFLCLSYIYIFKKNGYSLPFISVILPKIIIFICTLLVCFIINVIFPHTLLYLVSKLAISAVVYVIFSFLLAKSDILELLIMTRSLIVK